MILCVLSDLVVKKPWNNNISTYIPPTTKALKSIRLRRMNNLRDASFDQFAKLGFPTVALENYKYTDLKEPLSIDYGLNINRIPIPVNPYDAFKCDVPGIHSYLYFVVNDGFLPRNRPLATLNYLTVSLLVV